MGEYDIYRLNLLAEAIKQLNERLGHPLDEELSDRLDDNFQYNFDYNYMDLKEEIL